jgi:DNA-binding NtrC family response regulator
MHVLIVDDEVEFLSLIQKRLEHRDIQVTTANNASDAVKLVMKMNPPFDAVVMDVRMPGMDGLEGLHRMKQIAPSLPVILLTGHASLSVAVSGMELGAFDYLLKPIAINELIIKLEDAARTGALPV